MLVSLFLGATAGGLLLVYAHIYSPVLPFVITVAAVATAATLLRERRKSDSRQVSKTVANVERRVDRITLSSVVAMSIGPISFVFSRFPDSSLKVHFG
jgi:uncharacterized membrane protein YfcA